MVDLRILPLLCWGAVSGSAIANTATHPLFVDIDQITQEKEYNYVLNKAYKEKIRELLSMQITGPFQVGLDSFKVNGADVNSMEAVPLGPAMQPKGSSYQARGYGIKVRMKLK